MPKNMISKHWIEHAGTTTTQPFWLMEDFSKKYPKLTAARNNGKVDATAWHLFDMAFVTEAKLVIASPKALLHLDNKSRNNTR